jgi:uracil-DNA glycosylase
MPINLVDMFHNIDKKWMKVLTSETLMPLLTKALKELNKSDISTLTPVVNDIFNFARITPYGSIKVVIVGQDPYPKAGEAHGLAFSSLKTIPPSLQNIYKCLIANKLITAPSTGDLTYWARQGVLLLNSSLTTVVGQSNAHATIWAPFTNELIRYISYDSTSTELHSLIFMLWGNSAQAKEFIINEGYNYIEIWEHEDKIIRDKLIF